ncbi:hypothetical protein, unlikely [Trypanosoma congolense IL3000]|uniref:Uncharacterized protein n=1 Tax=Trypanosoma congolense (strain IL3000) TaxID=1068625 RepID=F9W542_TRYCI|nr:hypothetical protein, unlikely [Trypanosoma congolense IL3000]
MLFEIILELTDIAAREADRITDSLERNPRALRCRHHNPQPMRSSQLSASAYRRPFRSQSRMEPAALRQKGNKAAAHRLGHFSHEFHKNTDGKRKERNESVEGKETYSNEATTLTAVLKPTRHTHNVSY